MPGFYAMPNVQYVRNPGVISENDDALVLGMRVMAKFQNQPQAASQAPVVEAPCVNEDTIYSR